jgi:predicted ATPase/signal transduction histidine kinase/DNA-binding NarL/FixJ family response regulator
MHITGYQVERTLQESSTFCLHRGRCDKTGDAVLIKTARADQSNARYLQERLGWEYEISRALDIDGVVSVRALTRTEHGNALILEDIGADPLSVLLDEEWPAFGDALDIVLQLASILGAVHKNGVIHKAIHAEHVLVQPQTGQVVLTGFENASRLPDDKLEPRMLGLGPDVLTYLAPEQTGRMNRRVGFQTDFYSFGVLLYRLLTGKLPFAIDDPLELVHAHIAREPVPPIAVANHIPRMLSDIVMKLLAKAPEDRYQSAQGLRLDLEACLDGQDVPDFVPGQQDVSDLICIPEKLYGRAAEVALLMDAFDRVSEGRAETLLVSGYSGIGKSALVREVHKPIARRHGHFISGKFDQLKRNIPYSAFIDAFRELTGQLLAESESDLETWRARLREALGDNGRVITDVIPEIESIIGPQPPVPDLSPAESQNRFHLVFERFLKVFTRREHPLVVFLDDLQWADAATLDLLENLADDPTLQFLLIICAYRDNEVDASHPLTHTLTKMKATGAAMSEIVLSPLDLEDLQRLVSDTLLCADDYARPLTLLVHQKTHGNPFFVIQFIKVLHNEGLLSFDYMRRHWVYELAGIRGIGITDNVVDLMIRKIGQMPAETQDVVKLAACIGGAFDLHTLSIVCQESAQHTATKLREAIRQGLVIPLSEPSRLLAEFANPMGSVEPKEATYKFLHDRVQQAAYTLIPEKQRQPVHLRIGRLMWQHSDAAVLDDSLFEIVGHLNIGVGLISDAIEAIQLVELNLRAGQKAKTSTAYEPALRYFEEGVRQLPENSWESHYELAFELHLQQAECSYLCGEFDSAEEQLEFLLEKARSPIEKGEIYRIRIVEHENTSRFPEARDWGKTGLALFDTVFPDGLDERRAMLEDEIQSIEKVIGDRDIETLVDLPVMTDEAMRTSMRLLMTMWAPSFISGDMMLTSLIAAKMVHLSLIYGNVEESAYGYVTYAARIGLGRGDYVSSYAFGRLALKVNERFDDLSARSKVNHMFSCYIGFWRAPIAECFPYSREAFRSGLSSGDFIYAAYGVYHESWHALFGGQKLSEYLGYYTPYLGFMTKSKNQTFFDAHQMVLHSALALQGKTENPSSLGDDDFDESAYIANYRQIDFFMSFYYVMKLRLHYLCGQYDEAAEMARLAEDLAEKTEGMIWDVWRCFYSALTVSARYSQSSEDEQDASDRTLAMLSARLHQWAENCPENFSHLSSLVDAECWALRSRVDEAMDAYELAISRAAEHGRLHIEGLANERYAYFWMHRRNERIAAIYVQAAERCYSRWGATALANRLRERYPEWLTSSSSQLDIIDMTTVMRAAQLVSAEMEQSRLIGKLLRIVIENAGAEKGFLLLERQGRFFVEAKGSSDSETPIEFPGTSVELNEELATSIINYVSNSGDTVVLADASRDNRFSTDSYIQEAAPLSVLCTPILHQGRPVGMLYLENNLARDAFTPQRMEIVQTLASQATISLQNSRLYEDMRQEVAERKQAETALQRAHDELETRVDERTHELSDANERLRTEVTERRQAEVALQKAKETAEAADAAKGEFLASMSHELRTPLNSILGYTQILQRDSDLTGLRSTGIATIERSAQHLLMLINDILSFSKAEAGKLQLSTTDFDLRDFLDDICDIARVRTNQKTLTFRCELLSRIPRSVSGDERSLRQVLLNLVSNAVKFTERGGITLKVAYDDAAPGSPCLAFEVLDTGIGIAPDKLEEIFEPFKQLHRADRHEEGTGLGLAISRKLVEMMGGSIAVRSEPGEGSAFCVEMPLSEQPGTEKLPATRRIVGFEGARKKILVVDDKEENRAVLLGLLEPLGFELVEAVGGQEALEIAAKWRPDAILLDLVMPVMDGFEVARRIIASSELKNIVVLALSASVFEHNKRESLTAGCRDFIPKPVQLDLLLNKLREHLELTWIYSDGLEKDPLLPTAEESDLDRSHPMARPPPEVLESLRLAAMIGDVHAIERQLAALEHENELRPFVLELRQLANRYDMQKITDFVNTEPDAHNEYVSH